MAARGTSKGEKVLLHKDTFFHACISEHVLICGLSIHMCAILFADAGHTQLRTKTLWLSNFKCVCVCVCVCLYVCLCG